MCYRLCVAIDAEKEKRDAERKSRPFEFEDVTYKVETVRRGKAARGS